MARISLSCLWLRLNHRKAGLVSFKTVLLPLPKAGFQGHAMEEAHGSIKHGVLQL